MYSFTFYISGDFTASIIVWTRVLVVYNQEASVNFVVMLDFLILKQNVLFYYIVLDYPFLL